MTSHDTAKAFRVADEEITVSRLEYLPLSQGLGGSLLAAPPPPDPTSRPRENKRPHSLGRRELFTLVGHVAN